MPRISAEEFATLHVATGAVHTYVLGHDVLEFCDLFGLEDAQFAIALVDEAESGAHIGERFTVGY